MRSARVGFVKVEAGRVWVGVDEFGAIFMGDIAAGIRTGAEEKTG